MTIPFVCRIFSFFMVLLFCMGCSSNTEDTTQVQQAAEYIYRKHDEYISTPEPKKVSQKSYPWDKNHAGKYASITKDFFRCKGCSLNPAHIVAEKDETKHYHDCDGSERHSLPLKDGKEAIYPILIDLLNFIQTKLSKRVVITSGHRCPEHNTYVDPSPENRCSKHMVGGEVSFYIQDLEYKPEIVIQQLQDYFKSTPIYADQKEYEHFQRYEKADTNVSTPPWYNKEVFIKLFTKEEGRNYDNRHPYPYISIQVRYDRERDERVIYTWDKAYRGYHRW